MTPDTQTLAEAVAATKAKLDEILCTNCTIQIHHRLNDSLIQTILKVDAQKFREELRYKHEEVLEHSYIPGFMLILVECGDQPLGIVYGYDEPENGFFLDTLASMLERQGIGHILATLIIVHAQNTGYHHVTLYTEERDEQGRQLRKFYEKMGFVYLGTEPRKGDVMRLQVTPEWTRELYRKYIGSKPVKS
jgi:GNAT superfamily N-acetyltransferase